MTKKHYKIQSQKDYWFEVLSLFTDECLTKEEMEEYKHELAQRLADLVKNNSVLDDVNVSFLCDFVNQFVDMEIPEEAIKESLETLNKR